MHMNIWNKGNIRAILLSYETSTYSISTSLQNVVNISTINGDLFV